MKDLVVVGAGPTGIAALLEAQRLGLDAIALEAGPRPVASLVGYPNGLVLLSDAQQWEVGGLPFDCVRVQAPTREEALSYYARVVAHAALDIRLRHRVKELSVQADALSLSIEGREPVRTKNVLLTCWYEPKSLPSELVDPTGETQIHQRVADICTLPGNTVVIVGGGVSALEHATAAMRIGKHVVVVARGRVGRTFRTAGFRALASAAGAEVYPQATEVLVRDGAVRFVDAGGTAHVVPTESVIACIGFQVLPDMRRMLLSIGVPEADLDRLARARGPDGWRRARPTILPEQMLPLVVGERPDFHALLHRGHHGVRACGAALHAGGPDAGVAYSIFTAKVAVGAIAGAAVPVLASPLPRALLDSEEANEPAALSEAMCASIVPVAYDAPGHPTFGLHRESRSGSAVTTEAASSDLGALCDGTRDIAAIARLRGASLAETVSAFAERFRDGSMTWLVQRRA